MDVSETTDLVIGSAIQIHRTFGPGLLESAYEMILVRYLMRQGLRVECQKPIDLSFEDIIIPRAFVIDLIVNDHLIVELKASEKNSPVYSRQLFTYLKLTGIRVGLVINFGQETLKEGLHRVVNGYPSPFSVLRASV